MALMQSPPGAETILDGRRYLYFGGTGYLGLQGHPDLIRAACDAARQYGLGSATSRSGFGDTPPVVDVEHQAAAFFAAEAAFYLPSGYMVNHVLVLALEGRFEAVFIDELAHYSVQEAARLAGRPVYPFAHCDPDSLRSSLRSHLPPAGRPLVMTDGVFAALGRIAPLADYCDVLAAYPGAILAVDDAHGLGVLGDAGRGTLEHFQLFDRVRESLSEVGSKGSGPQVHLGGTLSKAAGGFGGIVPGTRRSVERLRTTSPHYPGASAVPAPVAAATARGLELMRTRPELRTHLRCNVDRLKAGLRRLGFDTEPDPVPVAALSLGTAENMRRIHSELKERGILVPYLPTYAGLGPEGALRLAVFATHTEAMIDRLLDELERVV